MLEKYYNLISDEILSLATRLFTMRRLMMQSVCLDPN